MSWTPRWRHVTQIHPQDQSGWNDCWEASLARYLRERDTKVLAGDDWALINAISLLARGAPDSPLNGDTYIAGCDASLASYKVAATWTSSYRDALNAPWAILLVDGRQLTPAQYPGSFFGAAPGANHFILWLPKWQGSANWFNDPLAVNNGQQDCQYDLGSVAQAFAGAYILPTTGNGETVPVRVKAKVRCGLLTAPQHGVHNIALIPASGQALDSGKRFTDSAGEIWGAYQFRDRYGYVPVAKFG